MSSFNDPTPPSGAQHPSPNTADLKSPSTLPDLFFDFSFATPITPRVVKWLYIISIIAAALVAVSTVITGFAAGLLTGLVSIFIAPILFLIYVLTARVVLEVVLAIFRIADALTKNPPSF